MPEGCVSKGLNKQWAPPKNIYLLLYACGSGSQERGLVVGEVFKIFPPLTLRSCFFP